MGVRNKGSAGCGVGGLLAAPLSDNSGGFGLWYLFSKDVFCFF